jgi:predicted Zn-dependent peptidase
VGSHRLEVLDNGLTVAVEPVPEARSVAVGVWVGVGSRDEPAALAGVGHFVEHALFKGTATRSARDLAALVERVGGDLDAFTAKECTAYSCRLPATHAALGFEVLGDLIVRPALRNADVDSERQVILEELAMAEDSPEDLVHRHLTEMVFPDHALGRETAGSAETVARLSAADLRAWMEERYRPEAMVVAVAGAVDLDEVLRQAEATFGGLEPGAGRPVRSVPPPMASAERHVDDETEQAHLAIGVRGRPREHPDREVVDVLAHVLGGGPASRLFDAVRERRGLAYNVYATASAFQDTGVLTVYAGTSAEQLGTVRELVEAELADVALRGVTPDELRVATGYLCGSYELGLETTGARMARLGAQLATTGRVRDVDDQLGRWASVGVDDVARVAAELLSGPRAVAVVGPGSM